MEFFHGSSFFEKERKFDEKIKGKKITIVSETS